MGGVADLVEGVDQGALPVGLECNVEVNRGSSGRVAQALPVRWNSIPCVLDTHVIPRYEGRREVSEGRGSEEGEHREPVISHKYRRSATKVVSAIQRDCEIQKARGPESPKYLAEMQRFYSALQPQNRCWSGTAGPNGTNLRLSTEPASGPRQRRMNIDEVR